MKRPVIIDTDLTVDDAVALAVVAQAENIDIKAVTIVGKNAAETAMVAETFCKKYNIYCQTGTGAVKPIFKDEFSTDDIYGEHAVYGSFLPCCGNVCDKYAWDVICAEAEKAKGELEILTLGPLTNIAVTLLRYPHIKSLIKRIFVVAGAGYTGNVAPYSEYNAYCDPDALQIVLDSGIPVVLCPLEATENRKLSTEEIMHTEFKSETVKKLFDICTNKANICAENNINLYSLAATAAFVTDSFETKDYYVICETRSGENQGWTIIDRLGKYKKEPNIKVVTETDKVTFVKTIFNL